MSNPVERQILSTGFRFGPMIVNRVMEHNGYCVISVETEHAALEITATPKGRKLIVKEECE